MTPDFEVLTHANFKFNLFLISLNKGFPFPNITGITAILNSSTKFKFIKVEISSAPPYSQIFFPGCCLNVRMMSSILDRTIIGLPSKLSFVVEKTYLLILFKAP